MHTPGGHNSQSALSTHQAVTLSSGRGAPVPIVTRLRGECMEAALDNLATPASALSYFRSETMTTEPPPGAPYCAGHRPHLPGGVPARDGLATALLWVVVRPDIRVPSWHFSISVMHTGAWEQTPT